MTQSPGPLLRLTDVMRETSLSKTSVYRFIREGTFPRPRRIGRRCVAWPASEIDAWKAACPTTTARS